VVGKQVRAECQEHARADHSDKTPVEIRFRDGSQSKILGAFGLLLFPFNCFGT
jgi:hypothetical protein